MTREEIMRLEGRELDAAVHERVSGRRVKWATPSATNNGGDPAFKFPFDPDTRMRIPHYSTDIAAAWQVVERMAECGYDMEISAISMVAGHADEPYTELAFGRTRTDLVRNRYAYTGPVPVAICRAALLAVCGEENRDADA